MLRNIFSTVVYVGFFASVMILTVLLIRKVARKRCNGVLCLLWGAVALRLLLPFSLTDAFRIPNLVHDAKTYHVVVEQKADTKADRDSVMANDALARDEEQKRPNVSDNNSRSAKESKSEEETVSGKMSFGENVRYFIPIVWLLGVVFFLGRILFETVKLKKKTQICVEEQGCFLCDEIAIPFAFGIFRPRIYIPSEINGFRREYALKHEKAHVRHKDQVWKLLGALLVAVYWFHPLVWVAFAMFCRDIELRCDDVVTADFDRIHRERYVQMILEMSTGRLNGPYFMTGFASGLVKERVENIRREGGLSKQKIVGIVIICAIVFALTMFLGVKYEGMKANVDGEKRMAEKLSVEDQDIANAYFPNWYTGYRYPVLPMMSVWPYGNHAEMVRVCQVPEEELKKMTTSELFETVLLYPLLSDRYVYDDSNTGVDIIRSTFNGLDELCKREDRTEYIQRWLQDHRGEYHYMPLEITANYLTLVGYPPLGMASRSENLEDGVSVSE